MLTSRHLSHDLVLTTGATQGLYYTLTVLVDLNGVIFVDEVTYMIVLEMLSTCFPGLRVVSVPMTADGVDVCQLRRLVAEHRTDATGVKPFWGLYYTIPVHHNPTGMTFTSGRMRQYCRVLLALIIYILHILLHRSVHRDRQYCSRF